MDSPVQESLISSHPTDRFIQRRISSRDRRTFDIADLLRRTAKYYSHHSQHRDQNHGVKRLVFFVLLNCEKAETLVLEGSNISRAARASFARIKEDRGLGVRSCRYWPPLSDLPGAGIRVIRTRVARFGLELESEAKTRLPNGSNRTTVTFLSFYETLTGKWDRPIEWQF